MGKIQWDCNLVKVKEIEISEREIKLKLADIWNILLDCDQAFCQSNKVIVLKEIDNDLSKPINWRTAA